MKLSYMLAIAEGNGSGQGHSGEKGFLARDYEIEVGFLSHAVPVDYSTTGTAWDLR
jgi:hypothetical protein